MTQRYTGPTASPEADAERWENEQEALDAFQQEAEQRAPGIVLKELRSIKTPAGWSDPRKFAAGHSAEDVLRNAIEASDDDVCDRYAEFMIDATPAAKDKLLEAMASWFCKSWAWEVYTEHLESLK